MQVTEGTTHESSNPDPIKYDRDACNQLPDKVRPKDGRLQNSPRLKLARIFQVHKHPQLKMVLDEKSKMRKKLVERRAGCHHAEREGYIKLQNSFAVSNEEKVCPETEGGQVVVIISSRRVYISPGILFEPHERRRNVV
ncbi:hypothetical protein QAD02_015539 [Eretmocerus hayati]|uniref:Uncharacterized protein n=1 Tax=Eretmocerus hayati TaxID=131215 RepID=A0ACC2PBC0_9HYME|nr:hypothetical protein QAD02_015539 [Eretmocerus hayati]